jgi:hypothetical protein
LLGRTQLLVFVRDELGVLSHKGFARGPEIKLFGVIPKELPMYPRPDKPPVSVYVNFGYAQIQGGMSTTSTWSSITPTLASNASR